MGFTTQCYIRTNTPELRKQLKEIEYREEYENCVVSDVEESSDDKVAKIILKTTNNNKKWN